MACYLIDYRNGNAFINTYSEKETFLVKCHSMFKTSKNPRVNQSMNMIADALLRLMKKDNYFRVTIKQICLEAPIAKQTFYRNFSDKEDVIDFILYRMNLFNDLNKPDHNVAFASLYDYSFHFFSFWGKRSEILSLFEQQGIFYIFTDEVCKYLELSPFISKFIENQKNIMLFGEYFWPAFLSEEMKILEIWVKRNYRESPSEIAQLSVSIFCAFDSKAN